MYFLRAGRTTLVGSSPEILVRLEDGRITLRPIAGTRRRGRLREDAALERELLADPKKRAEHVMLVDLGRNDVGRVAETGSVRVSDFMTVERYSHVMHIVSNVEGAPPGRKDGGGRPPGDVPGRDGLGRAQDPGHGDHRGIGTDAARILRGRRGVLRLLREHGHGDHDPDGGLPGNESRRSKVKIEGRRPKVEGGKDKEDLRPGRGGIVADSDPDAEFAETENKARAVLRALEAAERGLG